MTGGEEVQLTPSPGKFLKACSAGDCPQLRKSTTPLFSFIKGMGACGECTLREKSGPHDLLVFVGVWEVWMGRRTHPNVPECTRMYPNVPECTPVVPPNVPGARARRYSPVWLSETTPMRNPCGEALAFG